ncbi:DUF1176 domain-containing protein [Curvibacter sp. CHRR-16]|uniref:DUF1176 domain-containing protein n=1 Tax=Curvibacter sp. CHRR-16 TaxID=2835872 RepID=UPI001BDAC6FB|nr:DUF1176 domain-containing protein [Curvibacter sp. CHRR-16]
MLIQLRIALLLCVLWNLPSNCAAEPQPGPGFDKDDWELACDNTGTCRAAGYQTEYPEDDNNESPPASLLLTRAAGPGTAVEARVRLELPDDGLLGKDVRMRLNGKDLGAVPFDAKAESAALLPRQTTALLAALARKARIEFVSGKTVWRVSDNGSAAVLLKMDDVQGRVGTPGALVRKGQRPETEVPAAKPTPRLVVPPLAPARASDSKLAPRLLPVLRAWLKANPDTNCDRLSDQLNERSPQDGPPELSITRLDSHRLLVSTECWLAAYNAGNGYWVMEDKPPYAATFVTDEGSDDQNGEIMGYQKGRGIGDCFSRSAWSWDGKQFVQTLASTTGMCRGMAGGAWDLPTLVWEVVKR